ncbi:thioesterase II family protein [Nonomuraea recticatena]|uniref:Thioesterase II family protein n=1 Tax=Nonomuraea recticatena TaxID=46178 RepID=A0ABP6FMA9_9ACTN
MTEWVSLPCPRPEAAIRLFCLPYAGGGSVEYQQWADLLPATVEVAPVHLPGRERRIRQQPYTVMKELVADLADGLEPYLDRPYALFGYSLGAWVAFEVARELRRRVVYRGFEQPRALLLAAAGPPDLPRDPTTYDLPDPALVARMERLGGTDGMIVDDPRLLAVVLPKLRADLQVADTYTPIEEPALPYPIRAFTGDADGLVSPEQARAWQWHTDEDFRMRVLPGGHFFMHERRAELLRFIVQDLEIAS